MTYCSNFAIRDLDRRLRLPFGVPLEDIFPHDDIHPHLKALFIKTYQDIKTSGYSIGEITTKLQGTLSQRLEIKEVVAECKHMPAVVPPGALLWVIRHFMGLLPTPVLPNYTDEQYFSWHYLTRFCKKAFLKYSSVDVNEKLLTEKIAKDLLRLPSSNLLLFSVLINFIRLVTCHQKSKKKLNSLAAYYLVRYFSSCLFLRPFMPGRNAKLDKQYFPLLLYIVMRWPQIENLFKSKAKLDTVLPEFDIPEELLNTKRYYKYVTKKFKNVTTQTGQMEIGRYLINRYSNLETISEVSCETINYLQDTGAQTDNTFWDRPMKCCCQISSNYETDLCSNFSEELDLSKLCQTDSLSSLSLKSPEKETKVVTGVPNKYLKSTETYIRASSKIRNISRQNENTFKEIACNTDHLPTGSIRSIYYDDLYPQTKLKTERGTNTEYQPRFGWLDNNLSIPAKVPDLFSQKSFITDSEYIYDSYENSNINLLSTSKKSLENCTKEANSELARRISKIGWTYTPPKSNSALLSSNSHIKTSLRDENYTLYFNDKELLDKDNKENCSTGRNTPNSGTRSEGNLQSVRTKRSTFSVASIKSKLDFLKVFTPKRSKLKSSNSFDQITNIKYKKMTSTKSTTF